MRLAFPRLRCRLQTLRACQRVALVSFCLHTQPLLLPEVGSRVLARPSSPQRAVTKTVAYLVLLECHPIRRCCVILGTSMCQAIPCPPSAQLAHFQIPPHQAGQSTINLGPRLIRAQKQGPVQLLDRPRIVLQSTFADNRRLEGRITHQAGKMK